MSSHACVECMYVTSDSTAEISIDIQANSEFCGLDRLRGIDLSPLLRSVRTNPLSWSSLCLSKARASPLLDWSLSAMLATLNSSPSIGDSHGGSGDGGGGGGGGRLPEAQRLSVLAASSDPYFCPFLQSGEGVERVLRTRNTRWLPPSEEQRFRVVALRLPRSDYSLDNTAGCSAAGISWSRSCSLCRCWYSRHRT